MSDHNCKDYCTTADGIGFWCSRCGGPIVHPDGDSMFCDAYKDEEVGQEFDLGCSAAFPTFPLRTPGTRQRPEDYKESKRLAQEASYLPSDFSPLPRKKDEPQVTQWYVTVFALYDNKRYTTKVAVSGRSTVLGIIKVAEKQCADDHKLKDIPTLTVVAIVQGDHENMI